MQGAGSDSSRSRLEMEQYARWLEFMLSGLQAHADVRCFRARAIPTPLCRAIADFASELDAVSRDLDRGTAERGGGP